MEKITRKNNIAELISKHPESIEILLSFGLHCVGCMASHFDTIEEGARSHQLMDEEIDEMIDEINLVINNLSIKDGEVSNEKVVVSVNQDLCIGCETCIIIAPNTFEMGDNYKSRVKENSSDDINTIKEAANSCPVGAISVKDGKQG